MTCATAVSAAPLLAQVPALLVVAPTNASMSLSMGGSQNILNWACVVRPYIVSGNPTVSLSGTIGVTSSPPFAAYRMTQSGQIIYGEPGHGQRTCQVNFATFADSNSGNTATIRGSICDRCSIGKSCCTR